MADLRLVLLPVRSHAVMQICGLTQRTFAQTRIAAWIWTGKMGRKARQLTGVDVRLAQAPVMRGTGRLKPRVRNTR